MFNSNNQDQQTKIEDLMKVCNELTERLLVVEKRIEYVEDRIVLMPC